MKTIKLNLFGSVLTGRAYGKEARLKLIKEILDENVVFDFEGVNSLGSSFSEEVLPHFCKANKTLHVKNINKAIRDCLNDLSSDFDIKLIVS